MTLLSSVLQMQDVSPVAYMSVYRSREVGQSYVTSVWTTILAFCHAVAIVAQARPDVVWI